MRNLKYLKLFEAFESEKLSKTLAYVDERGRKELLQRLRKFCENIDFPFSKLDDSYFQYLPYKKALNLTYIDKQKPCGATSKGQFGGSHGIEGEVCQSGKLKRLWGARTRIVDCPNCNGSGIEPEQEEIKVLKYWFNKEGEYITTTCLDNVHKPKVASKTTKFGNINDYEKVGPVINRRANVNFLETGDMVWSQLGTGAEPLLCYVWRTGSQIYLLQDKHDGDTPRGREWQNIARLSWNITDGDFITLQKVELKSDKKDEDEVEEIDPFSFNKLVSYSYRGVNVERYTSSKEVERIVSKADFALIFNLESLKTAKFKKGTEIRGERQELKSGSRLTLKDSDIKKANIERYMQEIAKRSDIVSDVNNLPKVVKRIVGGENIFFLFIYNSRFTNNISSIADYYVGAIKSIQSGSTSDADYYKEKISDLISERYKTISEKNLKISKNIKDLQDYCRKEQLQEELTILEGLIKISNKLYQKITQMKFECVEDLDILKAKLDSIRSIFRSNRYSIDSCDYLFDSLTNTSSDASIRYLTQHYYIGNNKESIIDGIEQCLKVLDRF
jgi:hypothetical protein